MPTAKTTGKKLNLSSEKVDFLDLSGEKKKCDYYYSREVEKKFIDKIWKLIPRFIETYHLTLMTIPLAVLLIIASFMARKNISWLWLNSAVIIIHYLCDAFDGEIGRRRNTGLIKWGFYMDHFLDFIFGAAITASYLIVFPQSGHILVPILIFVNAFFAHELNVCVLSGRYNVGGYYKLGGPEIWFGLITLNIYIILTKPENPNILFAILLALVAVTLFHAVYKAQKQFWREDIKAKKT